MVTIVGGIFLDNAVDLYRKGKIRKLIQADEIVKEKHGHGLYLRMTLSERIQHATMALTSLYL